MDESRVFGSRPAILGHRGCGKGRVAGQAENTLGSFLHAVELGVDWLEVDVRRTADDQLVVVHHPADDDGVFYADMTGEDTAKRGVLRLEDRGATTAAMLAPVAAREDRRRPTLVTTFDPAALGILRELAPGVARGLLTWVEFPIGHAVAAAGHLDVQVLAAHWGSLRPNAIETDLMQRPLEYIVDLVHDSGCEFVAWCPPRKFARRLIDAGADALCVNDVPKVMASLLVRA
jgi:glycerophosphoryl diester phosphodiesterase